MKKNRMMRLASGLLVAVLATTSMISGTYAKYVTQDTASDVARVAKWGVTVLASGSLYGEKYATADDNFITASEDEDVVSVWGKQATGTTTNNVVAPGTNSDEGFHFAINGNPEVDALVTVKMEHQNIFLAKGNYGVMVEVTDVTADNFPTEGLYTKDASNNYKLVEEWGDEVTNWFELHDVAEVVDENGYWPVVYTMDGETEYEADCKVDTLKGIADAIAAKIVASGETEQDEDNASLYTFEGTKNIEQNDNLSDEMNLGEIGLSWKWAFEDVNDGADTILGNLMAERIGENFAGDVVMSTGVGQYGQLTEGKDYCLDTNFSIEITVEQVD